MYFSIRREWRHLYCVFTYIYSILIGKYTCDDQSVSVKLLCVSVCLISGDLFIFFGKSLVFLFLFLCYQYFATFPFHKVLQQYRSLGHICRMNDDNRIPKRVFERGKRKTTNVLETQHTWDYEGSRQLLWKQKLIIFLAWENVCSEEITLYIKLIIL